MKLQSHISHAKGRGFTLVEIMVVMVIITLVLGMVATSMSSSISGAEARSAARKLVASLRYTRARAIIDKSEQVFEVNTENRSYQAPGREQVNLPEGVDKVVVIAIEMDEEGIASTPALPNTAACGLGYLKVAITAGLMVTKIPPRFC